jgi:hypothetical protein
VPSAASGRFTCQSNADAIQQIHVLDSTGKGF